MSVANGGIPGGDADTIFTALMVPFPHETNTKINTDEFLAAARGVVALVDKLGKVFAPVRYDMNGNITKLNSKFEENRVEHKFLEDMIMNEQNTVNLIATDALMWLRRGLHFMQKFFDAVLADTDNNSNMSNLMKTAYMDTLEPFHGWMGAQLFNIMCRFSPNRREFFYILALDRPNRIDQVLHDMRHFSTNLRKCIEQLTKFYLENNLERHTRV